MSRQVEIAHESWPIAGSFTISRGSKTAADVVVVTLTEGGVTGRGECVPYPRYEETVPQVLAALEAAKGAIESGLERADIARHVAPKAARNALDCALWDLEAKRAGKPVWQLAGIAEPTPVVTAYTLSLDTPEAMAKAAANAADRPLLKLKLGREGDEERIDAIRRAAPKARLIVDANEGWSEAVLPRMLAACAKAQIELVEQPLPASADDALRDIDRKVVICADESAHDAAGIRKLIGKYDALNIKLDKTGGLTGALELARAARDNNIKIMVGCMLATSLAMAPAMLLAQFAEFVDLDGPLLLKNDRVPGINFAGSLMSPPPKALWG
ncbi:N-acetyl-D-Glu racemase DgcA [Taklimakanibacter albus]|uniref:Dipeptide epimerase n=1 Tax=Taklimakanibacter albus TaxID=2800327 RepID=A0ACC5QY54_9HYPH|nr:N-acetyl-D-Glu racemase DgcA [Aestuariivirga sp. YIM B02566]MBK1865331.1 dipeptide epimerase [Aestuariivirga sp. YIM B02566]